jgi:HSP20 family protein
MAALIRWNPASDLVNLHSEMDRLFGELTESMGMRPRGSGRGGDSAPAFLPVDIERADDAIVIRASVPGFKPEEVSVTVDSGVLTIDAQHSEESEQTEGDVIRRERYTGRLYRQILLGDGVRGDEASATFQDGELIVRVPLEAKTEPKKIPVQASSGNGRSQQQRLDQQQQQTQQREQATAGAGSSQQAG